MSGYGFILSITVLLESSVRITAEATEIELKMRLPHKAMKVLMGPLQNCTL